MAVIQQFLTNRGGGNGMTKTPNIKGAMPDVSFYVQRAAPMVAQMRQQRTQQQTQQTQQNPQPQIQTPQPQGIDWGNIGNQAWNIGKGIVEAPLKIPMKATASLLEPISGVTNIPFAGNTYQEDARQAQRALAGASTGRKVESALGSALQPALDIGGLALGSGGGSEALAGRQAFLNSIKTGAGLGAGYGAVGGMQQGQNIPQLFGSTAMGGVTGGVAGGALHGLLAGLGRLGGKGIETPPQETPQSKGNLPPTETSPPPSVNEKSSSYNGIQPPNGNNVNPLIQEARKYKSAEEFVKDVHNKYGGESQLLETSKLKPYETTINRETIDKLKSRMKSGDESVFLHEDWKGKTPAIRIEEEGGKFKVVDGNHRLIAAQELGIKNVPVHIIGFGDTELPLRVSYKKGATDILSQPLQEGGSQGITPKNASTTANVLLGNEKIPGGTKNLGLVDTIVNSQKSTPEMKSTMQGLYNVAGNKETLARAENRISTNPNDAYNFAVNTHSAEGNATAILLAKHMEANGQSDQAASLMMHKAQQALQAGQGNQIYAMWDKLSPETIAKTAAQTIERYNQTAVKKIPGLSGEQYQSFVDQASKIKGMAEGRDKGMATQNLLKSIGQLVPSSTSDKAFALWRAGLLTGLRTPGKIVASHLVSNVAEQAKNIPASIADAGMSLITGKRSMSLTGRGNIGGAKE